MNKNKILPKGFIVLGIDAGISKRKKPDMAVFYSIKPCVTAGFFTTNRVKAAPVLLSVKNIRNAKTQAIVANSGCANAATGIRGYKDALLMAEYTAKGLGLKLPQVLVASTGLIGSYLPMKKIKSGIDNLCSGIRKGQSDPESAALAIMTTDKKKKIVYDVFSIGKKKVSIWGTVKGSGMIQPNLATMLGFILTDINISKELLKKSMQEAVEKSFNLITVDGQTSTNDTVIAMASGEAGNNIIDREVVFYKLWRERICAVVIKLARMIAEDGEGATKFIEVKVINARTVKEAAIVGKSIANSMLFKTAILGESSNWGRVICAAGNSGVNINPDKIDIYFGSLRLAKNGVTAGFQEKKAKEILKKKDVLVTVDLKSGRCEESVYTCDLTEDYIKINADYN
jgi:glutamate N-acetyltransferase/amino-acid N-acetyltransferase